MKIIHTADVHLDSKMETNFDRSMARERREEILHTFLRVIRYGIANDVRAILISGDLFDTDFDSPETRKLLEEAIETNPEIDFYYLRGNHDVIGFFNKLDKIPENLKTFGEDWKSYSYEVENGKKITISGVELNREKQGEIWRKLDLCSDDLNIVMLHGELSGYQKKDRAEMIDLKALSCQGIDYLALGHIHEYREGSLLSGGKFCYSGCLEGRGFDECGEHGFVLLDIDENRLRYSMEFIPFAKRRLMELSVDITGFNRVGEVFKKVKEEVDNKGCRESDLLKIILVGEVRVGVEKSWTMLKKRLEEDFYFVKIYDQTKIKIEYQEYLYEASLKGEFVRLLSESEEEEKEEIIRCGLRILQGEEV